MTLPGGGGVSNSGQFTYSIPVQTPPGTAGMAPRLSLDYSSLNGDGFEGYGWALSGLDTITHCAAVQNIDGPRGAVNYNAKDKFCLNGSHLMLQSGTYGADGSTYYGYITAFTKFIFHNTGGTTWFEAHLRSGMEEDFGHTADSQLDIPGTTTAREWHVNKIIDKKGNYLTATYNNDATNGAIYPQRIDYTGNGAVATYNSVQFFYTTSVRPDETPAYQGGYLTQIPYLLTDIKTYAGPSVVFDYKLGYRTGSTTTHSRLTSVTQCDGASNCFAPTTFDWQGGTGLPTYTTASPGITTTAGATLFAGEFTDDGVTDVFVFGSSCPSGGSIYAGTGVGVANFTSANMTAQYKYWSPSPPHGEIDYSGPACFSGVTPVAVGDFSGDGISDVLAAETYWHEGVSTPVSTVLGSFPVGTGLTQLFPPPTTATIPQFTIYGDFNGDGWQDGYQQTSYFSGKPFFSSPNGMMWAANFSIAGTGTSNTLIAGDFNGDGCTDVLAQGPSPAVYFLCSSGAASGPAANYSGPVLVGDFNGDGKSDVLVVGSSGSSGATLYLSTGEGLSTSGLAVPNSSSWRNYQVVVGDWNGDGKTDVALIGQGTDHIIFLSTGTGFVQAATIRNTNTQVIGQVADWNSDGADDIWLRQSSGDQIIAFQFQPEMITGVHNGIGATTSVAYEPLNTNGTFYTRGAGFAGTEQMDGAYYVVSRVGIDDGAGVTAYHTDYSYSSVSTDTTMPPAVEARGQLPGSFLAFSSITATDSRTGNLVATTNYAIVPPLAGMMVKRTLTAGTTVLNEADYSYNATGSGGATAPQVVKVVLKRNDLNGTALPTIETDYPSYDLYNNPLTVKTINQADGATSTVINTFNNDDSSNWILGQLTSTTVEKVVGTSDITRHFNYTPDPATGLNTETNLEQGNTALEFDTNYQYDSFGNLHQVKESGVDIATRTTLVTYDPLGEFPNTVTNAMVQMSTLAFDARFGGPTSLTDPNSVSTTTVYDSLSRVINVTKTDRTQIAVAYNYCAGVNNGTAPCPANAAYVVTATPKSPAGLQAGAIQTTYYDSLGRVIAQDTQGFDGSDIRANVVYDANGNVLKTSRPYFVSSGSGAAKYTAYTYDVLHRLTGVTYPDSSTESYCYNGLTNSFTNRDSQIEMTVLNNEGQVSSVTEAASGDCTTSGATGTTASFTYDSFGNMLTAQDPGGNIATYTYDVRGRANTAAIPDRGGATHPWSFNYYVDSTLKSQTDANNSRTRQSYDPLMRPLTRAESDFTTRMVWDPPSGVGELANACTGTACTSSNYQLAPTYDARTRLSNQKIVLDGTAYTYTYTYDPATGNIASVLYPSGFQADYSYNTYGYLTKVTDDSSGQAIWQAGSADAELHLTSQMQGPSIAETANYDPNTGRLLSQCAATDPGPCDGNVLNFAYNWDPLGNLNYRQDTFENYTEHFCYDSLNRLTKSAVGISCNTAHLKAMVYDASGDIVKKSDICNTANCMVYGSSGNAGPHALSSIVGTYNGVTTPSFTYDNDGNMLSGGGRTTNYMSFSQPSSITQGTTSVGLAYDAFHERYKMCAPSCTGPVQTTNYLYDPMTGARSEKVVTGGNMTTWNDYVLVPGVGYVALRTKTGTNVAWRYMGLDHLGSIATLTDPTAGVVERDSYDPWGKRRNVDGSDNPTCSIASQTTRGYTGHEMLDSLCLINMNARVYDPSLGRFMAADSVVPGTFTTQAHNRFSYVTNNPLAFTDPTGHDGGGFDQYFEYTDPTNEVVIGYYTLALPPGDPWGDGDPHGPGQRGAEPYGAIGGAGEKNPIEKKSLSCRPAQSTAAKIANFADSISTGASVVSLASGGLALVSSETIVGGVTFGEISVVAGQVSTAASIVGAVANAAAGRWGNAAVDLFSASLGPLSGLSAKGLPAVVQWSRDGMLDVLSEGVSSMCPG